MGNSAVDVTALAIGAAVALLVVGVLAWALRGDDARRGWLAAAGLFLGLTAIGVVDLVRYSPRETPFGIVAIGALVPVLGTFGLLRGTRTVRPWIRWPLAFLTAFLLVFGGLLLGAMVARWLPV